MSKIKFVAEIENPFNHQKEFEIVAETPSKLIAAIRQVKRDMDFSVTIEKLLCHLFDGGPNGTGAAYCERNVCIIVRYE
jgi:hypothetical protein